MRESGCLYRMLHQKNCVPEVTNPEGIADGDFDEFLTERRDWTLSDENINMDVPAYADAAGRLHVVLPVGSIAEADSYEQVLTLDRISE